MFSRRKGRCCITATRRSSNAPLNPPVVSSAASSNNSRVSPANCPRIPPRKQLALLPLCFCCWDNRSDLIHDGWVGHFRCEGTLEKIPLLIVAVNRCVGLVG